MSSRRINLLDRPWRRHFHVAVLTAIVPPDPAELRASFVEFMATHPAHALAGRISGDERRWESVPAEERAAHAERVIREVAEASDVATNLANTIAGAEPSLPMIVNVGRDTLSVAVSHMTTDGTSCALILTAMTSHQLEYLAGLEPHASLWTLIKAAAANVREFGGRWWQTFRGSSAPGPADTAPDVDPSSWASQSPSPRVASHRLEPEVMAAANAWRKEFAPDVSLTTVLTVAAWRALTAESIPVASQGFTALFDLRRFLPKDQSELPGNLAKAIHVTADMRDPIDVHEAVQTAVVAGRALPATIIGALTSLLPRRGSAPTPAPLELTFSSMPALPAQDVVPWVEPDRARYLGAGFPSSPTGISVFAIRIGRATEMTASFDARTVSPDAAQRALARLDDIPTLMR